MSGDKKSEDELPAEYLASSLAKQPQVRSDQVWLQTFFSLCHAVVCYLDNYLSVNRHRISHIVFGLPVWLPLYSNNIEMGNFFCIMQAPPQKTEQEIQEEEELQLALALSQSEAEAKEKEVPSHKLSVYFLRAPIFFNQVKISESSIDKPVVGGKLIEDQCRVYSTAQPLQANLRELWAEPYIHQWWLLFQRHLCPANGMTNVRKPKFVNSVFVYWMSLKLVIVYWRCNYLLISYLTLWLG